MWQYAAYIWGAYAAAAVILPGVALASFLRLRAALKRQAGLEARLEAARSGGDEA